MHVNFQGPVRTLYDTFLIKLYLVPRSLNEFECFSKYSDYLLTMIEALRRTRTRACLTLLGQVE